MQSSNNTTQRPWWLSVPFVILMILLCGVIFSGCGTYVYYSGLQQDAVDHESALTTQYLSNQSYLSSYVSGFYEQVQVANLKSDKLNAILLDAVKGRYESSGGFAPNGAFFSAIVEAYPDVTTNMNIYDKIVDYVQAKREGYRGVQDKLLDMLNIYVAWKDKGPIRSRIIKHLVGAPTNTLQARIGKNVKYGHEALEQMFLIVNTESVQEAYTSGTMEPLVVPTPTPKVQAQPQSTPAPAPQPSAQPANRRRRG